MKGTFEDRFWAKVNKRSPSECWPWTASTHIFGYGQIALPGWDGPKIGAHRASWIVNVGPIPSGVSVLHKCDNPLCVNPNHLFLGTNKDNHDDMVKKGRQKRSLSDADVRMIRMRYADGGITMAALGRLFGCFPASVSSIVKRKIFKLIPDVIPDMGI